MTSRLIFSLAALLGTASVAAAAAPADMAARLLAAHNAARAAVGSAPLVWNEALARDARDWAVHLANTRTFEHATRPAGKAAQSENLWTGTASAYSYEEMVAAWVDEKQFYRRGVFPDVSTTGKWQDVGHYTQLIWHSTTDVGCAIATAGGEDTLVCRYSPTGNWVGQSAERPAERANQPAKSLAAMALKLNPPKPTPTKAAKSKR